MDELKGEVSHLKGRIDEMSQTIEHLTGLVDTLLRERGGTGLEGMGMGEEEAEDMAAGGDGGQSKKRRMVERLLQPKMEKSHSMEMLEANFNPSSGGGEAELFSQLSLDSTVMNEASDFNDGAMLERSFSDFKFGDEPDIGCDVNHSETAFSAAEAAAATAAPAGVPSHPMGEAVAPMAQHAAGYVAQAALGAAFTLMAAQQRATEAAASDAAASEGGALMRTVSNNGIAVRS